MPHVPTLDAAIGLHQAGRRAEAEAAYAAILAEEPDHPGALHALGVLRQQQGDSAESAALIERAIARHPADPAFHFNLGLARFRLGDFTAASRALAEAVRLNPKWPQAQYDLGNALREAGAAKAAARAFRAALKLRPDYTEAEVNLANLLRAAGKREPAIAAYRRVLRRDPRAAEAAANLAAALLEEGKAAEAVEVARSALAVNAELAEARGTLAAALLEDRRFAAAIAEARRLTEQQPDNATWHELLGRALCGAFRPKEALVAFDAALRQDPALVSARFGRTEALREAHQFTAAEAELRALAQEFPHRWEAHHDLGAALREVGRFAESEAAYRAALRLRETPKTLAGLGTILRDLGQVGESEALLRRAVAGAPRDPELRYSLATTVLTAGKYAEGFALLESRIECFRPWRPNLPAWDGRDPRGRAIVVVCEQGLGDTIQFMRYLPALARSGARAVVQAQEALHPLLRGFPGVSEVVGVSANVSGDACALLMSLPHLLRLSDPAPIPLPYLQAADPDHWRARLEGAPRPLVGLAWAGNPTYRADLRRSVPPAALRPFAALPGTLVSLQKDVAAPPDVPLLDHTRELTDLGATANLVASLDLVIAVDTAMAHLAGAMGKPVLLLNRFDSDWRWGMQGAGTRWYPSMRIVRQPAPGDWTGAVGLAVEAARAALHRRADH